MDNLIAEFMKICEELTPEEMEKVKAFIEELKEGHETE